MKRLTLRRVRTGDAGTFGRLQIPGGRELVTGELPERGNAPNISCIPAGIYRLKPVYSPHFKRLLYGVMAVPDRTHVLLHAANLMGDKSKNLQCELDGCIAPGLMEAKFNNQPGIANSGDALQLVESYLGGDEGELEIRDEYLEAGVAPAVA